MSKTAKSSKLLRFSLAAFALTGGGFGAGCSGTPEDEADTNGSSAAALVVSPDLVISQVYGGGGNTGATYQNDFIELFNRGTAAAALGGKSIQYASSTANFSNAANVVALPVASVPPGGYYLIQLASGGAVGSVLPTADLVTTGVEALGLANSKGKIALVDSASLLNNCGAAGTLCTDGAWIDFVSYGASTQAEGTAAGTLSNTTAALRKSSGCADTGNNSADFVVGTPAPRNSATTAIDCTNPPDAGPPVDAGTDSSVGFDASTMDSGPGTDAAVGFDASTSTDAAVVKTDAGVKKDSGVVVDDAGDVPVEDDAGTSAPAKDAGAAKKDAGVKSSSSATVTPTGDNSSGGCSVATQGAGGAGHGVAGGLGFFGLALAALGRRRRK